MSSAYGLWAVADEQPWWKTAMRRRRRTTHGSDRLEEDAMDDRDWLA
jgi:hypothetical protein